MECGITIQQANRIREDFKRAAHVHRLISLRQQEHPIEDKILQTAILLLLEEYDAIAADFEGMLTGNKKEAS